MKKVLVLTLLLFASIGVFAQEKTIKQEEFETVYKNSFRDFGRSPYRETRIHQTTSEVMSPNNSSDKRTASPNKISIKEIVKWIPTVGYHSLFEAASTSSASSKTEKISIDRKVYTRKNDGEWIELTSQPTATTEISADKKSEFITKSIDNQTEYKYLGNEMLNNQVAEVYAKIETSKLVRLKDNSESPSTTTTKYWFAKTGRLLKMESNRQIRSNLSGDKLLVNSFNLITTYEIDPNIKIEAPILN